MYEIGKSLNASITAGYEAYTPPFDAGLLPCLHPVIPQLTNICDGSPPVEHHTCTNLPVLIRVVIV
jgi:hypothetical protein